MVRFLAPALLLLTMSAGTGGCAHWPWNPYKDWEIARSKRFIAYAQAETALAPTLAMLEQSYAVLQAAWFNNRPIAPVDVLLLDWPEFRGALGAQRTWATIAALPGKGPYGRRGLIVMYGLDTTSSGAIHRLMHLFLHASAPRAPLWLHEGFASYAETAVYRDGGTEPTVCLGQLPQKQPDIPLAELFAWSWGGFDDAGQPPAGEDSAKAAGKAAKNPSAYRFTATNLVDFFMLGEGGKLRDKFPDLIAELAEGAPSEAALAKVYPSLPAAALQDKVREHRRTSETSLRGLCPLPFAVPPEKFADSAKTKLEPAPPEEIERLFNRLNMLPRRDGHVDWYPPEMIGIEGGQFGKPAGTP